MQGAVSLDTLSDEELGNLLHDNWDDERWRLNHLYSIVDRDGNKIPFVMNPPQREFYDRLWYRNVILKARQLGFTTLVSIMWLDACLFNDNFSCAIVADTKDNAEAIFRKKVVFAWKNLDGRVKEILDIDSKIDRKDTIEFSNGSSFVVSVTIRSMTAQRLHISEYGKISVVNPGKAREIKRGSFPAVPKQGIIIVESTSEGRQGEFYNLCKKSMDYQSLIDSGQATDMVSNFRFHFYPWYREKDYEASPEDAANAVIPKRLEEYFNELEESLDIHLSKGRRAWYMGQEDDFGDDMKLEHPSTAEEAFHVAIQGAYFAHEMNEIRRDGRIVSELPLERALVDTYWDIGINDTTAILFVQMVDGWFHLVDFYEHSDVGIEHYCRKLHDIAKDRGFYYGAHFGPHDLNKRSFQTGVTTADTAASYNIFFQPAIKKPKQKIDSIEAARKILHKVRICNKHCSPLINHLDNYRKEWNQDIGRWSDHPRHDEHSHGADAVQLLGMNGNIPRRSLQFQRTKRVQVVPTRRFFG